MAVNVHTFGTSNYSNDEIKKMILELFSFKVSIINRLMKSDTLKYHDLASCGHVGRTDSDLPWERTDKASLTKEVLEDYHK